MATGGFGPLATGNWQLATGNCVFGLPSEALTLIFAFSQF